MPGDLNAKHLNGNLRQNTRRGKLLRDYADEISYLIFGPRNATTNPFNTPSTPVVLDIVIAKDIPFPVYLTSSSALSSDHLPAPIDTARRSSFQNPPDRRDFRRTDWAKFQTHLEDQILFDPELHNGMESTHALRTSPAMFRRLWQHLLPNVAREATTASDSKSTVIIYARTGQHFFQPRTVALFGEPIQWVDTIRYLGVTLDKRLT